MKQQAQSREYYYRHRLKSYMICQNETIFIHIPKTGGTSVTNAYNQQHGITQFRFSSQTWQQGFGTHYLRGWRNSPPHWMYVGNMHATYDQYALQYPDWKYVAQVRHPYNSLRSAWSHLVDISLIDTPFKQWVPRAIASMQEGRWNKCIDDKDALYELHIMKPSFDPSIIMKPQWIWVRPGVEIHKLEERTIWKRLNLKEVKMNISNKRDHEWTDKNKELVYEYYKKDFEQFYYGA